MGRLPELPSAPLLPVPHCPHPFIASPAAAPAPNRDPSAPLLAARVIVPGACDIAGRPFATAHCRREHPLRNGQPFQERRLGKDASSCGIRRLANPAPLQGAGSTCPHPVR